MSDTRYTPFLELMGRNNKNDAGSSSNNRNREASFSNSRMNNRSSVDKREHARVQNKLNAQNSKLLHLQEVNRANRDSVKCLARSKEQWNIVSEMYRDTMDDMSRLLTKSGLGHIDYGGLLKKKSEGRCHAVWKRSGIPDVVLDGKNSFRYLEGSVGEKLNNKVVRGDQALVEAADNEPFYGGPVNSAKNSSKSKKTTASSKYDPFSPQITSSKNTRNPLLETNQNNFPSYTPYPMTFTLDRAGNRTAGTAKAPTKRSHASISCQTVEIETEKIVRTAVRTPVADTIVVATPVAVAAFTQTEEIPVMAAASTQTNVTFVRDDHVFAKRPTRRCAKRARFE